MRRGVPASLGQPPNRGAPSWGTRRIPRVPQFLFRPGASRLRPGSPVGEPLRVAVIDELARAAQSRGKIRVHTDDEVAVVRVLRVDADRVLYEPVTSSRPERYASCDATAFELPLAAVRRTSPVRER